MCADQKHCKTKYRQVNTDFSRLEVWGLCIYVCTKAFRYFHHRHNPWELCFVTNSDLFHFGQASSSSWFCLLCDTVLNDCDSKTAKAADTRRQIAWCYTQVSICNDWKNMKMIANSEEIAIWDTGESSREPTGSPKPSSEPASRELQHVVSSRKDSEELRT